MSDHLMPTAAELNELADEYQSGLDKMVASGYEEFSPAALRQRRLVVAALRAFAVANSPSHIHDGTRS